MQCEVQNLKKVTIDRKRFPSKTPQKTLFGKTLIKYIKCEPHRSNSKNLSVRQCVCSLLRHHLNVFFPPLPEVGCPETLKIMNPSGKVMERSCHRFETF